MLDINFVRSNFSAFNDKSDFDRIVYADNGGAAFIPKQVVNQLAQYLENFRIQPFSPAPKSQELGEMVLSAYRRFAEFINAESDEIVFNASTSANFYMLSQAMSGFVGKGDEIIVTNLDHECNVGFWRREAERLGATVREWCVDEKTASLNTNDLEKLITLKTRLVAVTHCSSVTGEVNDIKKVVQICNRVGAKTAIDGVSLAPHIMIDVKELDVDFYAFSIYKMFGPHLGLLYIKKENYPLLKTQSHYFLSEKEYKKRFSPAGPQYGEILAAVGVLDYFESVFTHHFPNQKIVDARARYAAVYNLFRTHEVALMQGFLDGIAAIPLRVVGPTKLGESGRVPNISMLCGYKSSKQCVLELSELGVICNCWHFYSRRLAEAMNVDTDDGFLRASFAHYNTIGDIEKTVKAFHLTFGKGR